MAWALLEYILVKKFSIIGFCSGIISGLVGITPAAGFVPIYFAALIGALTSCTTFFAVRYKYLLRVDDGLDIFAIHGVGGFVGDVLTGFFAADYVPAMDGVNNAYEGGWYNRHWKQMGYQLAAACTCAVWSFVISIILLFIINKIPGCHIRATAAPEDAAAVEDPVAEPEVPELAAETDADDLEAETDLALLAALILELALALAALPLGVAVAIAINISL